MPRFVKDFDADFDAVVAGLLPGYDGEPYALARFADGEGAIMWGETHEAKSDGWAWRPRDDQFGKKYSLSWLLMHAIECELPGWHVGIPAEEHDARWHKSLGLCCEIPPDRVTFAELFCFANYQRFAELDLSRCITVGCHSSADYHVPLAPQDQEWPRSAEYCVSWLVGFARRPIILSAGPWAKILVHGYWLATVDKPEIRQTIIDVGSALSPSMLGRNTRRHHNLRSPKAKWKPRWSIQ